MLRVLKDFIFFRDDSYASHLKCITEDQKYGGSDYVQKEFKGEKKQEMWISNIQEAIKNSKKMNPQLKTILDKMLSYSNVPRKKKKFQVFLNSYVICTIFRINNSTILSLMLKFCIFTNTLDYLNTCHMSFEWQI